MKNYPVMVDDVAALRANGVKSTRRLYIVKETGDLYHLDLASTDADDGRLVIKPAWAGVGAGRLLIFQSGAAPQDEGQKAQNILRIASVGKSTETVTIGADVYELATNDALDVTGARIPVDVSGGATVKARGRITISTGVPDPDDEVEVGGKTYTFKAAVTGGDNVDGNVKIGGTIEATIDNLVAAINLTGGAGYAAAMTAHTTVTAIKSGTDKVLPQAINGGTIGNAITLSKTGTNLAVDAATLGTEVLGVDPSAANVCDALLAAINASATEAVVARKISNNELQLLADAVGVVTIACTEGLTGANNGWAAAAMYGGRAAGARKFQAITRVPTAVEVALGNMHFELNFTPAMVFVRIKPTATPNAAKAHDGGVTISTTHIKVDNAGSTDWAETDTIEVLAFQ